MANLITKSDLQKWYVIADTLPDKFIGPCILQAQELFLRPLIGAALYAEIIAEADGSGLSSANQALVAAASTMLGYRTLQQYFLQEGAYSTPSGIMQHDPDHSRPLEKHRRQALVSSFERYAETYMRDFSLWLRDNADTYPLLDDRYRIENPQGHASITHVQRSRRVPPRRYGQGPAYRED
jgi:hypothetical protein